MPDLEQAVPQFTPTLRELDDLELMRLGALGSSPRFEPPGSGGVTLVVPPGATIEHPGRIDLLDLEGARVGTVDVEATYPAESGVGVVGDVVDVTAPDMRPFRDLYVPAIEAPEHVERPAVVVPVSGALSDADISAIDAESRGGPVLLLALVGTGTPRGLSAAGLIRATLAAAELLDDATVVAVPLARHDGADLDAALLDRVLEAYAPGASVVRPQEAGPRPAGVAAVVERENPRGVERGAVVFFTGLSGSGKSTLATALLNLVAETGERRTTSLDGDVVRHNLSKGLTFSAEDRETNIRRIGWVAAEIARHGGMVVCSPIAPFDATRREVRRMVEDANATFVLVHVATPLEECERRDRKGLYAKARAGQIPNFTGISSPYEVPQDAEVVVDTTGKDVATALAPVLDALRERDVLTDLARGAGNRRG
ncbi:adenylyl-sulfate kinase [Georgenia alba]|uniref:Adenylyl-sulfate kinase n=1 Tax=Georgenia alba TaxID=2233858 RepID=A0ABW2Q676_9MICO